MIDNLSDIIQTLKSSENVRDAKSAVLIIGDVVVRAIKCLYVHKKEELPEEDSILELIGGRHIQALIRRTELQRAFDYIRILVSHAERNERLTKNSVLAAREKAWEIVNAIQSEIDPSSNRIVFTKPLTEAETRKEYIDVYLKEAGWEVVDHENTPVPCKAGIEIEVTGMPPNGQNGYCDYVLYGSNGAPLAVVEAKRTTKDPESGRKQVQLYGERLVAQYGCEMPVLYYTNGYKIWCIDGLYPDREVVAYHSREELEALIFRRRRKPISDFKVNKDIAGRPYQMMAVKSLCEWLNSNHRRGLLVMATGTGKTRVAVSLVDVLSRNDWVKNVLFLADRTELVDQAKKAFAKHLPQMPIAVLSDDRDTGSPKTARIVFSTYHTMIRAIDAKNKKFGIGRFDLVITDEAHRSIFNKFGTIFDYFDSLLVGLTATPRNQIDANTYTIFGREVGDPNFEYTMKQGREEGYLVGWKLKNYTTETLRDGIVYADLSEEERQAYEEAFCNAGYGSTPALVDPDRIFRSVYNKPTCARVLDNLMQEGLKVESGDLLGKTIIFAYNHIHAQMIVETFREMYPNLGANYCQLIDNHVNYSRALISDFKTKREFRIAVSVDMLDTGVDVPEVLNLVFFKKVRSKIKFFQMLGRGTRLAPDVFGAGRDKDHFLCFDYCGNFEFFGAGNEGEDESKVALSLSQKIFSKRIKMLIALQDIENQSIPWRAELHKKIKEIVYSQIEALHNQKSRISVRKAMPVVDKYFAKLDILSESDIKEIDYHLTPLVEDLLSENELVKLFDCHMLSIELSLINLGNSNGAATEVAKVRKIASRLKLLGTIAEVVAKKKELDILESDQFWLSPTLEQVEELRLQLRALMIYLRTDKVGLVVLHVDDNVVELKTDVGLIDIRTYREKVVDYLYEHIMSPAIDKIRKLEPINSADLKHLEIVLWKILGTKEQYDAEKYSGSLPGFVRSLIDLDENAVQEKFGEFLDGTELNSDQQEFVRDIVDYMRANGEVTLNDLTNETPFVDYDISSLFQDNMPVWKRLRDKLSKINTVAGEAKEAV